MLLLDNETVKFKINGKLYTFIISDTDTGVFVKNGENKYYIATKEDVLKNIGKEITYTEYIKAYSMINGIITSLGIKENLSNLYTIIFNDKNTNLVISNITVKSNSMLCEENDRVIGYANKTYLFNTEEDYSTNNVEVFCNNVEIKSVEIQDIKKEYYFNNLEDYNINNVEVFCNNVEIKSIEICHKDINYPFNNLEDYSTNNVEVFCGNIEIKSE